VKRCAKCSTLSAVDDRFCAACGAGFPATPAQPITTPLRPAGTVTSVTSHDPIARFLPGSVLAGRYRLVALLGRGGMGEVYRAEDLRLGQSVALKFLPDALARDAASREALYGELRVGRQVAHPNVCRLYDLVEFETHQCLSMEFVEGEDLAKLLTRIGRLPADKVLVLAHDLLAGLAAAHDRGVIHRDLKPGNVMLDQRGRARITDFGIAALVDQAGGEAFAGTPAYMAPELFNGAPASVQSDLYALGLLLFEALCGRRGITGGSLADCRAAHQRGVDRVPLRDCGAARELLAQLDACLDPDPQRRPRSALAMAAALPGGDPLQRALAAGETPTPAMVAAAAEVGDLRPSIAWALLILALLTLLGIAALHPITTLVGQLAPERPPAAMVERARAALAMAGHRGALNDSAHGFTLDEAQWQAWRQVRDRPDSRAMLRSPQPLRFIYRQSPEQMIAWGARSQLIGPSWVGRIQADDPGYTLSGMAGVELDGAGRLIQLRSVPVALDAPPAVNPPDVPGLLQLAGLDPAALRSAAPRWTPPVASTQREAWVGAYADSGVAVQVELARFAGEVVWFAVIPSWQRPQAAAPVPPMFQHVLWSMLLFGLAMSSVALVLVMRHLREGRGDRRGALRVASFVFVASLLAVALRADAPALLFQQLSLWVSALAQALYFAFMLWLTYLALEPFVRRRWPNLLIGWSRLLDGRWHDPMVGRELLIGLCAGLVAALALQCEPWLVSALTNEPALRRQPVTALSGLRHQLGYLLFFAYFVIELSLCALFLRYFVGRGRAGSALAFLAIIVLFYPTMQALTLGDSLLSLATLVWLVLWAVLLLRVGLLAASACLIAYAWLFVSPIGFDFERWYIGTAWVAGGVIALVLLHAFRAALAGRPAFGRGWLRD